MAKIRKVLTPEQKEAKRKYHKEWADKNRERLNFNVRAYRKRRYIKEGQWRNEGPKAIALQEFYLASKAKPCHDCGGEFPACCMDFDHRKGTVKAYNVGSMAAHHYSMELIQAEIAKCDLVCANCHRIRTRDRRTGSGTGGNA